LKILLKEKKEILAISKRKIINDI